MSTGIVYIYTSPSGKSYIGQTWNEEQRKIEHKKPGNKCIAFKDAIKKYGYETFKYEILHKNISNQFELDIIEESEIKNRNTISPFGYNLMEGGGASGKRSVETRKKISKAKKGCKLSEEHRLKIVESWKKRKPDSLETRMKKSIASKNRQHAETARKKISESLTGRKHTEERKMNMAKARIGRKLSEEHKRKISEASKNMSDDVKKRISETMKKYYADKKARSTTR